MITEKIHLHMLKQFALPQSQKDEVDNMEQQLIAAVLFVISFMSFPGP
jgi:hypothetical protein